MREEIFGPLLPVETYSHARRRDREDQWAAASARLVLVRARSRAARPRAPHTLAGGVTVNDTLWHFAHEGLPFGGVGGSGFGAYHGERGFVTFSHEKPVFIQSRHSAGRLLHPPYGRLFERVLALLRKLNG